MGLDVSGYAKVSWVAAEWDEEKHDVEDGRFVQVYSPKDVPDRLAPLKPGVYESLGARHDFRAGSYSGYNAWREWLCRWALGVEPAVVWRRRWPWQKPIDGPFVELINYSDAEGTFGTFACAKLARDFAAGELRVEAEAGKAGESGRYYLESFYDWAKAFRLAAEAGCVTLG